MLLFFLAVYLSSPSIRAAPLPILQRDIISSSSFSSDGVWCLDQRSVWDILWSCLATIFTCCWVSVHPNVAGQGKSTRETSLRRLELMALAISAPELIIYWAMRQWLGAQQLARLWSGKEWTEVHGHFIQMGGFMLYKANEAQGILSPEQLKALYEEGRIDFPTITEEEIRDRSKADGLAKTLALGQTAWFLIQCLARHLRGLDLSALELITVAFAILNGFMYYLWWNKPFDVRIPVPVYLLDNPNPKPEAMKSVPCEKVSSFRVLQTSVCKILRVIFLPIHVAFTSIQSSVEEIGISGTLLVIFVNVPTKGLLAIGERYSATGTLFASPSNIRIEQGEMQVATFYAYNVHYPKLLKYYGFACLVGIVFGAIHCLGWFYTFPSHIEALMWRISSVAMTGILFAVLLHDTANAIVPALGSKRRTWRTADAMFDFVRAIAIVLYVFARLYLIVEAFISLRALPPKALETVSWTSFIPHI